MIVPTGTVAHFLGELHYLGATGRGFAWSDEYGVLVLAKPTARYLPQDGTWLELVRWCLVGVPNGGSRQWSQVAKHLHKNEVTVTTVVSYSDPSAGHTGALYKACNWKWAPTWHRLHPPPTGNGSWTDGEQQSVKDRWVYELRPDSRRTEILRVAYADDALIRAIRRNLTPDLLAEGIQSGHHPMQGHCYVASQAYYHLKGGKSAGLKPYRLRVGEDTHWWVQEGESIVDITADQFPFVVPYEEGRASGFLTAKPDKRTQELIGRLLAA